VDVDVDIDEDGTDGRNGFLKLGIGRALNNRLSLGATTGVTVPSGRTAVLVSRRLVRTAVTGGAVVCLGRGRARNLCVTGAFAVDVRRLVGEVVEVTVAGCWDRLVVRSSNGLGLVTVRVFVTPLFGGGGGFGGWMDWRIGEVPFSS